MPGPFRLTRRERAELAAIVARLEALTNVVTARLAAIERRREAWRVARRAAAESRRHAQ